jgi:hypothetical protein
MRRVEYCTAAALAVLASISGACSLIDAASGQDCDPMADEEECCDDGQDNDGDLLTDCGDPNCDGRAACSGGGGECDPEGIIELGQVPLNDRTDNTCSSVFILSEPASCSPGGQNNVAVLKFHSPTTAENQICVNYSQGGTGTLSADPCGQLDTSCISLTGGCMTQLFQQRDYYLVVPATSSGCGDIEISVRSPDASEVCLNGSDDDTNGNQDCEEPSCRTANPSECNHPAGEICDGIDNSQLAGFPAGSIDELACRCVNDQGCDQLVTGNAVAPYVCHTSVPNGPVCAPNCFSHDWCAQVGLSCGGGGRCN